MRWLLLMIVLQADPAVRADEPAPAADVRTQADEASAEAKLEDDTRLLLSPTGRPLRRGSGYLSDHEAVFPGFPYGLTDNISLSAGMSLIPNAGQHGEQAFFVSPRVGKRFSDRLAVSGGLFYARVPESFAEADGPLHLSVAYAVATLGRPRGSLTAGVYADTQGRTWRRPTVMLRGQKRLYLKHRMLARQPEANEERDEAPCRKDGARRSV